MARESIIRVHDLWYQYAEDIVALLLQIQQAPAGAAADVEHPSPGIANGLFLVPGPGVVCSKVVGGATAHVNVAVVAFDYLVAALTPEVIIHFLTVSVLVIFQQRE